MEHKAYDIARSQYCLPERKDQRVAMAELFHLIAGSETGGVIAANLVNEVKDKKKSSLN